MTRRLKGETNASRRKRANFLKIVRKLLKERLGSDEIRCVNKIARQAWAFSLQATGARLSDRLIEVATIYRDRKQKLAKKHSQFIQALDDMDGSWFDAEINTALKDAGISVDTASGVFAALDKAIYSQELTSYSKKNQRPKHDDYHFNVPLGSLLIDSGLNRKSASKVIAQIRLETGLMTSENYDIDRLSKRIEDQLSYENRKLSNDQATPKNLMDEFNRAIRKPSENE
ncbi:MAG: hypothetical protein AB2653_06340 [Candidatus Thiodiazotropha endolucinida]